MLAPGITEFRFKYELFSVCPERNIVSHIFTVLVQYQTKCADIYFSKEQVAQEAIKDVIEPFMEEHPDFVW